MNTKNKIVAAMCAGLCAAMAAGSASAETVTFTGFSHGYQTVRGQLSAPNVDRDQTVRAGGFATSWSGDNFTSYCVDFYQFLPGFGAGDSQYAVGDPASFFGSRLANVRRLFSGRSAEVNTSLEEAAFQIALWEIFYEAEGNAYNVAAGAARFSDTNGTDGNAATLAQTYLDGLAGYAQTMQLHLLTNRYKQDVVWATEVPEPGSVALMLAGLGGIAWVSRRRSRAAQA